MFEEYSKKSGIYCFENIKDGKKYIGKSIDLRKRILDHINSLRRNSDECAYLQNAWNKHREENFKIYIIEVCSIEEVSEKEIFYIQEFGSKTPNGYNLTNGGDGTSGYTWNEEKRNAIKNVGNHFYGKKHSEETKKKMAESQRGSKNHNYGKIISDEIKNKMSENHADFSGQNHPQWGKPKSNETKNKIRMSLGDMSGENNPNFGKKRKNASSKYFGVSFHKHSNKWFSFITVNKKLKTISYFETEEEAAKSYDAYVIENNLPNPLNFPENYE